MFLSIYKVLEKIGGYVKQSDYKTENFSKTSIVIKTPVTKWRRAKRWGDYHMAVLLKEQLQIEGYHVLIQILPEWDNAEGMEYDVAIVLRGLSRYKVKTHQVNIMWNISHPDKVTLDEYEEYDHVFIASDFWAETIAKQVSIPVEVMLQCTDPERFHVPDDKEKNRYHQQLLFVGNSRDVYRKILKDLMPTEYDLAVYGKNWKKIISRKYIKAEHIQNNQLYKYYGSAEILLNDHWDDMREKGFVSNRIFDGLACGAFILTDSVNEMGDIKECVQVYDTAEELQDHIKYYLKNPDERLLKAQMGMSCVLGKHTFKERAKQFSVSINNLMLQKSQAMKKELK